MKNQMKKAISTMLTISLIMILVLPVISFAAIPGVTLPEFYDYEWTKSVVLGKSPIRQTCEHFQGFTLDWITDGDTKTSGLMNVGAAAPTEKGYVVYDLGETCKIGGATLDYNYRTAVGYNTLYGASDPEGQWTEILRFDDISGLANATNKVETKYFDKPADAPEYRYIKLEGEKPGGVYKINELEVYALLKVSLNLVETIPEENEDYSESEIILDFDNNINLDSAKENIEIYKGEAKLVCGDDADYTIALDEADATKAYITLKEAPEYNVDYRVIIKNTLNSGKDGFVTFADGTQDKVINFKNKQALELSQTNIVDGEMFIEKEINLKFNSKISLDSARNNISIHEGKVPLVVDNDYTVSLTGREKTVKIELVKAPKIGYTYTLTVSKDINKVAGYIPFDESVVTENIVYTFDNKDIAYNSEYLQRNRDSVEIETSYLHDNSSKDKTVVINGNDDDAKGLYIWDHSVGSHIIFDLKKPVLVGGAKLVYNYRTRAGKVTISGSNDKTNWKKIDMFDKDVELTADENKRKPEVIFDPEEYQYIKLEVPGVDAAFMIFEFYLYAVERIPAFGDAYTFTAENDSLTLKFDENPALVSYRTASPVSGSVAFEVDGVTYARASLTDASPVAYVNLSIDGFEKAEKTVKVIIEATEDVSVDVEFFRASEIINAYETELKVPVRGTVSGMTYFTAKSCYTNLEKNSYVTYKAVDFGNVKNPVCVETYLGVKGDFSGKPYEILIDGIKASEGVAANTNDWYTYGQNNSSANIGLNGIHDVTIRFPYAGTGNYEKLIFKKADKIAGFKNIDNKTVFGLQASAADTGIDKTCKLYIALYDSATGKLLEADNADITFDGNYVTAAADIMEATEGQTVKAFVFGGETGLKPFINAESISVTSFE